MIERTWDQGRVLLTVDGQRVYTTWEAVELSGLSYRQVDYADRRGKICPSVAQARGSGSDRLYSAVDIAKLRVLHFAKPDPEAWTPRWAVAAADLLDNNAAWGLRDAVIVVYRNRPELMTLDDLAERIHTYQDVVTVMPCAQLLRGL